MTFEQASSAGWAAALLVASLASMVVLSVLGVLALLGARPRHQALVAVVGLAVTGGTPVATWLVARSALERFGAESSAGGAVGSALPVLALVAAGWAVAGAILLASGRRSDPRPGL